MYTSMQRGGCQIICQPNNYRNIQHDIKRISSTNQYEDIKLGLESVTAHKAETKFRQRHLLCDKNYTGT